MAEVIGCAAWLEVVEEMAECGGVTMLIGDVDAGKSSLARYLASETVEHRAVSVVDADVGQSALCIPGTVSTATFRDRQEAEAYRCRGFVFVGTANPAHAYNQIVEATASFVAAGRNDRSAIIVDTGGLVTGPIGRGLKLAKVRMLQPDRVIAIQRAAECEPILQHLDEVRVFRLAPSPHVTPRSREVRARYRLLKLKDFLETGERVEHLLPARAELIRLGRPVSLRHVELPAGTLVGLNHDKTTLDIGVITEGGESPLLKCRLKSLDGITRIVFGDLTIAEPMLF